MHSLVALAAIARPALFRSEPMAIDIETAGELTRGMTVFDRRGIDRWQTNIDVVRHVDAQGVLDYFSQVVSRA
jgi:inosine-uridine nucleoside N-ribohydrolase